jgi:hypothetical protein
MKQPWKTEWTQLPGQLALLALPPIYGLLAEFFPFVSFPSFSFSSEIDKRDVKRKRAETNPETINVCSQSIDTISHEKPWKLPV